MKRILPRIKSVIVFTVICFITSTFYTCHKTKTSGNIEPLFQSLSPENTGVDFVNKVEYVSDFNVFKYRNFYNGGGVAIGDVNNDGKPDIFFTANQGQNHLYLNKGDWKFDDVTISAGVQGIHKWHTGVTMADVNGDGWLDIYICNSGDINGDNRANELYINQKNGTFKEEAHAYGLDDEGLGTQAVFFDYDHDGDLDCYVLNNSYRPIASFGYNRNLREERDNRGGDKLYRNDNGKFIDVSAKANIYGSEIGFGLGVSVSDLNNDGWDDIYVSNDFFERDYLYINQKNGTFKETLSDAMGHISEASMGSDVADINNDGNLDVFTTDMLPEGDYRLKTTTRFDDFDVANAKLKNDFHHQFTSNCLQLNNGDGTYSEIAEMAGVDATDWSWGALCFDLNNDGWKDYVVCNGISKDLTNQDFLDYFGSEEVLNQIKQGGVDFKKMLDKMPSTPVSKYAFVNQKNCTFKNEAKELGLSEPGFSNGAAYGDLDGDGDLDLIVNNENAVASIYRNMTTEYFKKSYLKIKLDGQSPNTFGIGAKVTLFTDGDKQVAEMMQTRGFESSVEPILNFGLGNAKKVDSLTVVWPNMMSQTFIDVDVDTTIVLHQTDAKNIFLPDSFVSPIYKNVTNSRIKGDILHREDFFIDFDKEPLIPKMISTEGPKIAVGDVNGDGLQDFFIGGAKNDTGKLFIQQSDGTFVQKMQVAFNEDKNYEDIGAEFFDADNDGDSDLIVASGGNEDDLNSIYTLPRLYLNDGRGNFVRSRKSLPLVFANASCVRVFDFNNDGKKDIFIGARSIPGSYGSPPNSILLQNLGGGNFVDVTKKVAPELLKFGMVTDAQYDDMDGDGIKELIVAGDWMPITIFKYQSNQFKIFQRISHSSGWWNCLVAEDINGDGKIDLIAGNSGINTKIKASEKFPAKMFVSDFNDNGNPICITAYYKSDGRLYPYILRGDLIMQMPYMKKKFLKYDQYAGKTIDEVFTKDELDNAYALSADQSQSCMFINNGHGSFTIKPLPEKAQLAPVFGIDVTDLNGDGIKDIFLGGNFYGLKPEIGRWDASYGCALFGDKKYNYSCVPPIRTGLFVKGEVRDIKEIETKKGKILVVARNNEPLQIFSKEK